MYLIGHNSSRRRYLRYSAISRYENSRCYWRIFCIKGCVEMFDLLETYRERYSLQTKRGKKKEEYHRSIFPRFSFIFSWCSPCAIRIQRITSFFFFLWKKQQIHLFVNWKIVQFTQKLCLDTYRSYNDFLNLRCQDLQFKAKTYVVSEFLVNEN